MNLQEWLQRVGFLNNPFALKQADDEGDQLNEYFVAHPSYNTIVDSTILRSNILHAPRGSGKSSLRRMFQLHCQRDTAEPRTLVVQMTDWMPITARRSVASVIPPEDHFHELARRVVLALAQSEHTPWAQRGLRADVAQQVSWLCLSYNDYLIPAERRTLARYGWLPEAFDCRPYAIDRLPIARRVQLLADLVQGLGFRGCYVLIDGVDELLETAADWAAGANLIEALLANLAIVEAAQIAFKFFIPSEVVYELQARGRLRGDRIQVLGVQWDDTLLQELLSRRLQAFSNGLIERLAQLNASPSTADIDGAIVQAAAGSPRALLNLGDALFQIRANRADDQKTFIEPDDLEWAMVAVGLALPAALAAWSAAPPPNSPQLAAPPDEPEGGPLLELKPNGEIWLGDQIFTKWGQLTPLQRRFVSYLYENRARLCTHQEVIDHVWATKPADNDSLRKLVDRMIALLEPDPKNPRYIQKVPGYLRLIHTVD